jgi:1,6-anhydro-N-acetylmuramate kinase
MAGALGWDAHEVEAQARAFLDEARAEGIVTTP